MWESSPIGRSPLTLAFVHKEFVFLPLEHKIRDISSFDQPGIFYDERFVIQFDLGLVGVKEFSFPTTSKLVRPGLRVQLTPRPSLGLPCESDVRLTFDVLLVRMPGCFLVADALKQAQIKETSSTLGNASMCVNNSTPVLYRNPRRFSRPQQSNLNWHIWQPRASFLFPFFSVIGS